MRRLFFTSTSPIHSYKSEKFFYEFKYLKDIYMFGRNRSNTGRSVLRKMSVVFRFIKWFYDIKTRRTIRIKQFLFRVLKKNNNTQFFGLFYKFISMLELNIQVILVRSNFVTSMEFASDLINSNQVCVNGKTCLLKNTFCKVGDLLELVSWQLQRLVNWRYTAWKDMQLLKANVYLPIFVMRVHIVGLTLRQNYKN